MHAGDALNSSCPPCSRLAPQLVLGVVYGAWWTEEHLTTLHAFQTGRKCFNNKPFARGEQCCGHLPPTAWLLHCLALLAALAHV